MNQKRLFVEVILPLALPRYFTYEVPENLLHKIQIGIRVEVPFGKNKLYAALIAGTHHELPKGYEVKSIVSIIDDLPIITLEQLKFWDWIASYYCCTLGEVMIAALPISLRLSSETTVVLSSNYNGETEGLDDKEYILAEALTIQSELTIEEVRGILQQKTVFPLIKRLLDKGVLYLKEELKVKYKPKSITCIRFTKKFENQESLSEAFEITNKSSKQQDVILSLVQSDRNLPFIKKQDILKSTNVDASVIAALIKKGIVELYDRTISRLGTYEDDIADFDELSSIQLNAKTEIYAAFQNNKTVLLHGVTGSGKTNIYVDIIKETIAKGKQVLYLLPEIALTTQIVARLQKVFGNDILVYHSKLNNSERVEIWYQSMQGKPIILGARSALFLPFKDLDLIIVDEEHDGSFKQDDTNPKYQGRDCAIYLANQFGANVILGSATPSVESYYHAKTKKYELVNLFERYSGIKMPEIFLVDIKKEFAHKDKSVILSDFLIGEIKKAIESNEQVILFQNRRGFAPNLICNLCEWVASCPHCDVTLTYHKYFNHLRCHYCNYQIQMPKECPSCKNKQLITKGFGTEKIEDELSIYFPNIPISRMDLDTVRAKGAHSKIIKDFEENRTSILVGTQMVTKGLDFENVSIVGILGADQLLYFPDFRAIERSFQIMVQAAGRSGRRNKRGKVIIQAIQSKHPVFQDIIDNNYLEFYKREIAERQQFLYPPFVRLIQITLKHKNLDIVNQASTYFANHLKSYLKERVKGPAEPGISKIRDYYIRDILIKIEKNGQINQKTKSLIQEISTELFKQKGMSQFKISINVDP
ncbi:MAG: primosomal protein N' [Saprospiraceae bacterium]|nr:primosomal protein N' [Saprospiraceae bacterium]